MDLYCCELSAPCRAVMLTAKALGLNLNKISLKLIEGEHKTPEFTEINPQQCVPTLVDDDLNLWESRAICTYLASQYGEDDSLYPTDPKQRVLIDKLLYFDIGTLQKRYTEYISPLFRNAELEPQKLDSFNCSLKLLDGFLEGHDYSVGDNITVADFVMIASLSSAIAAGVDVSEYPNISAWVERCENNMVDYETENGNGAKAFGEFIKSKINSE